MAPLINADNWVKHRGMSVNSLQLDLKNPRLPGAGELETTRELIAELVRVSGIEDLAGRIVRQGYIPVEDVIAVEENGKKVIVEGNRRLCACKLLLKPTLAPKDKQKVFQRLAKQNDANLVKKIPVVIAPNRAEANVYIYSKHADDNFSKKWSRIQQCVFIAKRLEEGYTREEISSEIGIKDREITVALAALELFKIGGKLDLTDSTRAIITDPTRFPYGTVIERIFTPPDVKKAMGISISKDGEISGKGDFTEFKKAYAEILERTQESDDEVRFDTRTLSKVEPTVEKIKDIFSKVRASEGSWSSRKVIEDSGESDGGGGAKPDSPKPKTPKSPGASNNLTLVAKDFSVDNPPAKLGMLLEELKLLPIRKHLQSSGILLRCILELALLNAIQKSGKEDQVRQLTSGPYIVLSDMLKATNTKLVDLGLNPSDAGILGELASSKGLYSVGRLNAFVHGTHYPADYNSIVAFREKICRIVKAALKS